MPKTYLNLGIYNKNAKLTQQLIKRGDTLLRGDLP